MKRRLWQEWKEFDRKHLLHPYTSMSNPLPSYLAERAYDQYIQLEGRQVIDGMSNWWCGLHGHNVLRLNQAISDQMNIMSHVMFGGITHKGAVELGKLLLEDIVPHSDGLDRLTKVFLCDSGSVSVEVAMKMAHQYSFQKFGPENRKTKLLTIRNGYHGDTFGAMSVCDPVNGMHHLFKDVLNQNFFVDAPTCSFRDQDQPCVCKQESGSCGSIQQMRETLDQHADQISGIILEPIVQGAGGMRFYSPNFLTQVRALCDEYDILLICDEIATGFGRTGELLGSSHAGILPDILCLGKSLTGGYMTMGATLTNDKVAEVISKDGGIFAHGPTFMGNPLACAVAIESTKMILEQDWRSKVAITEKALLSSMESLSSHAQVQDVRVLGAIGVCELKEALTKEEVVFVQEELIKRGVWLRPFGKLLYTMPTFLCPKLTVDDVQTIGTAISEVVDELDKLRSL